MFLQVLTKQLRRWDRRHIHQDIAHVDSDESNEFTTIHEHEGTLIQLKLNPSSLSSHEQLVFTKLLARFEDLKQQFPISALVLT